MRRFFQVVHYAIIESKKLSIELHLSNCSRIKIFLDMLICYLRFKMWTNQYIKERMYELNKNERNSVAERCKIQNLKRDKWQKEFQLQRKFIKKYGNIKYEKTALRSKRIAAYTKKYKTGTNLFVEWDVDISRQHYLDGHISIGNNVSLAKHVFIDYSGSVVIEDGVHISARSIVESHRHEFLPGLPMTAFPASIRLEEGVWVGTNSIICESCKCIGRFAQIGAGSVVRNSIPPYAIVIGNPANIIGFKFTPEEVEVFEKAHFPENKRTDIEKYKAIYKKFFETQQDVIKSLDLDVFISNFIEQFDEIESSKITSKTDYKCLDEWDSMIGLSVIAMINAKYDVQIKAKDLSECKTVEDLFNRVIAIKK